MTVKIKNVNFFPKIDYNYVIIVVSAGLIHGLLLLNDGVYWDGWLIYDIFLEKDWSDFYLWVSEMGGLPIMAHFYRLLVGIFPGVIFGYKLVAFLSITFSALFVYMICNELRLTNRKENLFIALLSLSYPAFQVSVELSVNTYLVCYCLFLLACLLAIKSEGKDRISHYFLRLCSLASFILCFKVNSLLVFYFGFLFILVFYIQRSWRLSSVKDVFTKIIPRRLDYLLLPFLYWIIIKTVFPPHGLYADYNRIAFSPLRIIYEYIYFTKNAVYAQLNDALVNLINMPVLLLLGLLAAYCVYLTFSLNDKVFFEQKLKPYSLLLFGFILLLLGIFPYAVVGKHADAYGVNTRHALLVALPMAIILIGIFRLLFSNKGGSISKTGYSFIAILLIAFALCTITNYISWQSKWVTTRSIMTNLAKLDNAQGISVFWIDYQFPEYGKRTYPYQGFYVWSSMFKNVWGDESRIGLDLRNKSAKFLVDGQHYFNKRYNLSDFDPNGRQAILTIRNGSRGPREWSNIGLSIRYLYYKYFRKNRLAEFLSGVTDIEIQPIPVPATKRFE